MQPHDRTSTRTARLVIAVLAAITAACSSQASTRSAAGDGGAQTTAAPVTAAGTVPPGTTLRIGDQLDYLKNILARGGQDADLPYTIEWSAFVGGPPMLQAFRGGSLDAGFVASTPLLFADAQGQSIAAIAGWAAERGTAGILTTDPSISGWATLKGKRVAYQRGTSLEAGVLAGLDEAGLSPSDITTVDVPYNQLSATLESGSADAGLSSEPLISAFTRTHPDAKVVAQADEITDRATFLIAAREALDDPARNAALADLTIRLVRALRALNADPAIRAEIYRAQYGLSPERALEISTLTGTIRFLDLPGDIVPAQQRLSRLFHQAGQIPREVEVSREFDARFAPIIATEQGP